MNPLPNPASLDRRKFLHGALASAAVLGFPAITQSKSPNGKLNVGLIGVGGRGRSHVNACKGEHVVALCDVNAKALEAAKRSAWCKDARTYPGYLTEYKKRW